MNLNLMMNDEDELKPRITVFGVGGAGGNAVNNMIEKQLEGVTFVVANTDAQALAQSRSESRVQLGPKVTEGLGAGAKPAIGAKAAEETIEDIVDHLMGAHMCFITAGMGGGTGTGAAPIIAQAAREMGILTVGVVTKPFQFEGNKRMRQAEEGVQALQQVVDTLIIIPNQNLFRLANEKTTFTEAFAMADDVLYQGVKGVTDLMVRPGIINLDFADVRAVMDEMGKAMMGTGEASGENRAVEAAEKAIANPLLDEISLNGAKGVLINITAGDDLTLFELDEAAEKIREKVDPDANIIVGSSLDPSMEGKIRVSVVATGIDSRADKAATPAPRRGMAEPLTQNPTVGRAVVEDSVPVRRSPIMEKPEAPQARADEAMPEPAYTPKAEASFTPRAPEPQPEPRQPEQRERRMADVDPLATDGMVYAPKRDEAPRRESARDVIARRDAQPQPTIADRIKNRRAEHDPRADERAEAQPAQGRMAGFGRLIERMSGNAPEARPQTVAERVQEQVSRRSSEADFDDLASPDAGQGNVEIPAFLRRQAN